jgi:hypothetical protein
MSPKTPPFETEPSHIDDPRWKLVERIVASPSFAKSDRLCRLLLHICELSLQGRAEEINELKIGETLFGRARNYDSSVDGIVRSHASRLRHRLEQYFSDEGRDEELCLLIPRGAYLPVFETRPAVPADPTAPLEPAVPATNSAPMGAKTSQPRASLWMAVSLALGLACAVMLSMLSHSEAATRNGSAMIASHPLWGKFFAANQSAIVVCSDAGLTSLQQLSGHSINLAAYLDADYPPHIIASPAMAAEALQDVVARRYTSIVDLLIVTKFYQLAGVQPHQIEVQFARDVRPDDLKNSSVILLGSHQTDPWVEMFEGGMNFTIQDDMDRGISAVIDHSPRGNELSRYVSNQTDPMQTVYAVVALRRNPEGSRYVLMLEGTSMAGTEAAADFVFDDTRLLPFLNRIRRSDGSVPDFEVLLQSSNLGGYSPQSKIVAYRTTPN